MGLTFFLVTPCRNAAAWIGECIRSVRGQSHRDWSMAVIDDASDDDTARVARAAAAGAKQDIRVIRNETRRYALRNVVEAIDRYAPHDSIVAVLDGDDRLSDPDALREAAREYAADDALDALWTRHAREDGACAPLCRPLPEGVSPLDCDWRTSHLKTFRKRLIWGVDRRVWLDDAGRWWKSAYDVALYLPVLCLARRRKFLNRVCYVYNRRAARDHAHPDQAASARAIWAKVRESEARRKPKNVLFFVSGVAGGDSRFAWRPGCAYPPMGVLTLMARLKARGHAAEMCDRYLEPDAWPTPEVLGGADVIGVYGSTPNAPDARRILRRAREESRARLLAGGPHASVAPRDLAPLADAVCRGEADDAILDLVERNISGTVNAGRTTDLDAAPFPDYARVAARNLNYCATWPFSDHRPVGVLNSSRGCPHECAFCGAREVTGRQWRGQSPERAVNDMEELRRVTGARAVYFREDNFACDKRRVRDLCAEARRRGLLLPWACELRADAAADEELVADMASAGCRGFYIGFESGSQRMLDLFRKKITVEQCAAAGEIARRHGIGVAASLIVGHPAETDDDRACTDALMDFIRPRVVWRNRWREPATAGRPA